MNLMKNVKMDELAEKQFRITLPWGCDQQDDDDGDENKPTKKERKKKRKKKQTANDDDDDDAEKTTKKERKKKRKKKKKPPTPAPQCEMCRLGPAGAARRSVRHAALWCCTRCALMCCSALRVLVAVVGVVGICLAAFYILSPSDNKDGGARVMRASLRALGPRLRGPTRAPSTGTPGGLRATSELDRPDCPGDGPDGADCGPGNESHADAGGLDIEVVAAGAEPFQVVDSSIIVSPHDPDAASADGDDPGDEASGADVPNDPER